MLIILLGGGGWGMGGSVALIYLVFFYWYSIWFYQIIAMNVMKFYLLQYKSKVRLLAFIAFLFFTDDMRFLVTI